MKGARKRIGIAASVLRAAGFGEASTGIVLGTGLGGLVQHLEVQREMAYTEIPHFPEATVEFHEGRLLQGMLDGHRVVVMQGRFHHYEGWSLQEVVFPVQVLHALGVRRLLLSNAAGAIQPGFPKGSLMLLTDHVDLLPGTPLIGPNDPELGRRFPDMGRAYDPGLNALFRQAAVDLGIVLQEGIYAAVKGPNLETPAEYRMLRTLGANAVGMSTVPEVIACAHLGLPCAAVSVLTDACDPDHLEPVDIADIIATAGRAEPLLVALFREVVKKMEGAV